MEHCLYSLNEMKKNQKYFSEIQIRKILKDICTGLKFIHNQKIVHLDIKPGLLLTIYFFYNLMK